jgi:hypothetical protein
MAQPVWVLSVDLQTKTATFETGLSDAVRTARGSFNEIKGGAGEMGREVSGNMMEARHGVMLLGEEFGVHLPRALTTFIASIGPVGAAFEAAFPFLAIAVGATLLIEALVKMHEAGEKVTEDQVKFGTAVQTAFNQLDQKILQAGIRADELRNDHLGALAKQLQLIDAQSMEELVHSFGEIQKAADLVFGDLKSHWFTFGIGATGAKHALDQFQTQYDSLLAQGKDKEAGDLLAGTLKSAEKVLAMQKQASDNSGTMLTAPKDGADVSKAWAAENELKKAGVGFTEKEVTAQQTLVEALQAQVGIEEKVAALKKQQGDNASRTAAGAMASEHSAAEKEAASAQLRMGEEAVAADRATAQARLEIARASVAERLASEIDFARRERDVQLAGNAAQIAALDKLAKDYPVALQTLKDKSLEITQQYETKVSELTAKADVDRSNKSLVDIEQGEREKIDATQKGSAARLAVINAAIKAEQALNMQDIQAFRELLTQRVQTLQEMAQEEAKQRAEAGAQEAAQFLQAGQRMIAAQKETDALINSSHHVAEEQRVQQEIALSDQEFAVKMVAYAKELAALDKANKDYLNKVSDLQAKEKALVQQHEDDITRIKEQAEIQRNTTILNAEQQFDNKIAASLTQVIMGHKSFAAEMASLGNEVVSGMIQNAIKSMLADDMTKERDAAAAARKAYVTGESIGGPAGLVLGPVMAAAAYTAVLAFSPGGIVPGVGSGDVVPAMLTPGEGVIPGGVMDGLDKMARSGHMTGNGPHYTVHNHIRMTAHAMDADGVDEVFTKHADRIQRHFETSLRKMNR